MTRAITLIFAITAGYIATSIPELGREHANIDKRFHQSP